MKRIFVAVDLPDAARNRLGEYSKALRTAFPLAPARWVEPENMHITLHFAGSIDDGAIENLNKHVAQVAAETGPLTVVLQKVGAFVSRRTRANVLWIGGRSHSADEVWNVLEVAALSIQELDGRPPRRYSPHVTLARLKKPDEAVDLISSHLNTDFEPISFEVNELVVYESALLPTGSVYNALSRHALLGNPSISRRDTSR